MSVISSHSVVARVEAAAETSGGVTFLGSAGRDGRERVPWAQLHEDAAGVAAALQARGVAPGVHVALLGPTTRQLVTTIQAVWLAGGTLVCLPLPMRLGSIDEFVIQTRRRILNARARSSSSSTASSSPSSPSNLATPSWSGSTSCAADPARWVRPDDDPERLAIVQFTSGSTDDPKGVMIPHRCLVENIDAIVDGAGLGNDDVGVSWLPLYHDMGLIGLLMTPMTVGFELGLAPPQDFLVEAR